MSSISALARKDVKSVYRDRFMVMLVFYTWILALAARVAVPLLGIPDLGLYLAPTIPPMGAMILGTLMGFALIEEREQGTWLLLRVLPVSGTAVFGYLAATATGLSFLVGLVALWIYGYPVANWPLLLMMLIVSSLAAPLVMLILGAFAANKIEGMALSKFVSATGMLPAILFIAPLPWQALVFWCPWYWIYVGLLQAFAAEPERLAALYWPGFPAWPPVVVPLVLCGAAMSWLVRAYTHRAG